MGGRIKKLLHRACSSKSLSLVERVDKRSLSGEVRLPLVKGAGRFTLVNLTEGLSRSRNRFISLLTIASLSTIFLLSLFLSILPSTNKGKAADSLGANDTGSATLRNVSFDVSDSVSSKYNTFRYKSVKIGDKTLNEGTDDATGYRTILGNNAIKYNFNYWINRAGAITIVVTLSPNSEIDNSSISSNAGCQTGSKLVATDDSETNNRAICILNATTPGSYNSYSLRVISLWGYNGELVTPDVQIGTTAQSLAPNSNNTVKILAAPNYKVRITNGYYRGSNRQTNYSYDANFDLQLYSPMVNTSFTLGDDPIDGYSIDIDMSDFPVSWQVSQCLPGGSHHTINSPNNNAKVVCTKKDNQTLHIEFSGLKTALASYPQATLGEAMWTSSAIGIMVPTADIVNNPQSAAIKPSPVEITSLSGQSQVTDPIEAYPGAFRFGLYSKGYIQNAIFLSSYKYTDSDAIVYPGYRSTVADHIALMDNTGGKTNNVNYCTTWDASKLTLASEYSFLPGVNKIDPAIEYGVLPVNESGAPSSNIDDCGKVGDDKTNEIFFSNLADARQYAKDANQAVNAIRVHVNQAYRGAGNDFGKFDVIVKSDSSEIENAAVNASVRADGFNDDNRADSYSIVPGLLGVQVDANPTDINKNEVSHVVITPIGYGKEYGAKIVVDMSQGVSLVDGSVTMDGKALIAGSDYTTTVDNTGATHINVNLGTVGSDYSLDKNGLPVAADNGGKGVSQPAIEFDVISNDRAQLPSSQAISATSYGVGTDMIDRFDQFRYFTKYLAVSAKQKTFSSTVTASASSIILGDDLSYSYNVSNNTDGAVANVDEISILPFNGDSRGTNGLLTKGYYLNDYGISNDDGSTELYYTTDTRVRDYETSKDVADVSKLATDGTIVWTKFQPGVDKLPTADEQGNHPITAICWKKASMATGDNFDIKITLSGIDMADPSNDINPIIGNDISYLNTNLTGTAIHQTPIRTSYLGEQIGLTIFNPDIAISMTPNSSRTDLTQTLNYSVNVKNGYSLTASSTSGGNLSDGHGHSIPSISNIPVTGVAGWSMRLQGETNWRAIPDSTNSVGLSSRSGRTNILDSYAVTYGVSTDYGLPAGVYTGKVTYTLAAGM